MPAARVAARGEEAVRGLRRTDARSREHVRPPAMGKPSRTLFRHGAPTGYSEAGGLINNLVQKILTDSSGERSVGASSVEGLAVHTRTYLLPCSSVCAFAASSACPLA
jgi:hypothetical protein